MEFENNLKLLRVTNMLSQMEVARGLNISRPSYAQYELGIRRPNIDMLYTISGFYDIRVEFLFNIYKSKFISDIGIYAKISAQQRRLLDIFDELSEFSRGRLLERAESILERDFETFEAEKNVEGQYFF